MRGEKMRYERRERRGFVQRFPPKPVEIGKEYDVTIEETSRRGEGITRIKGLVTFIPNAKPGDKVRIKITRIGRRSAEAEVVGEAAEEEELPEEEAAEEEELPEEEAAEEEELPEEDDEDDEEEE
jgi:predicted RNA-binding protein with TRAM domain